MFQPKKVVEEDFELEKEIVATKSQIGFRSWIICFLLISFSIFISTSYLVYKSQGTVVPKSEKYSIFSIPNNIYSLNSSLEKKAALTGLPTKKYEGIVTSNALGIYELNTGKIIYEQNAESKLPFASITKLLTVTTMESLFDKNTTFTIDPVGVNILGSRAGIKAGDKFGYTDAIYGMMLPSGNDIAMSVAMKYGYENYIKQINTVAKALDLKNTHITNPVGFDDLNNNYSSIRDIFTMSRFYLQKEINRTVANTAEYEIKSSDPSQKSYKIESTNDLLDQPEVHGLKTGTEDLAGQCLVLYIKSKTHDYIAVLLHSTDRFREGQKIIDWLKING